MNKKKKLAIAMVIFLLGVPAVIFLHLFLTGGSISCHKNLFSNIYHHYRYEAFGRDLYDEPCPARSAPYPALFEFE